MTDTPAEFNVCNPLAPGVTVLEASAGTGKTHAIASLSARYVAEGTGLDKLLLVTFTRIAASELRERVRQRLIDVKRGLDRVAAGGAADDELVALLAQQDLELRCRRLEAAIYDFDAATIATTHSFCQEMLSGLGIAGDLEPDLEFSENVTDLVADVVSDLYIRKFRTDPNPGLSFDEAHLIAARVIANPSVELVADNVEIAQLRLALAQAVRKEVGVRKRRGGILTYDDLVTRLKTALTGAAGELAKAMLRRRFQVVMVDEFQDTDPDQWEILRLAFADDGSDRDRCDTTLILIADPKQAIYGFRDADVYAYLRAKQAATANATLPVNWRTDQGLIDALGALMSGVKLGHPQIPFLDVRAAPANQQPRLSGAPVGAPMRIRLISRTTAGVSVTDKQGAAETSSARERVRSDLAEQIVALLDSGATIEQRPGDQSPGPERERRTKVGPGDLAVLVRSNFQAQDVRRALAAAGVPAVDYGAQSVYKTEIAGEWLTLLESLERPADLARARAAALTCFVGWTAERLGQADSESDASDWETVHGQLHEWSRVLRTRGVAALLETITVFALLTKRVLSGPDGERRMTDLRHIGELLHAAAASEHLGATALTGWLRARIEEEDAEDEQTRRLESDAAAVQVLTIHRAKGLEFPIVFLPFLWDMSPRREKPIKPVFYHDDDTGRGLIDVGLAGSGFRRHRTKFWDEERGEELRLAYVALTRARHQTVLWWAPTPYSRDSALSRLLFARGDDGTVAPNGTATPTDAVAAARFAQLAARAPNRISIEPVGAGTIVSWSEPLAPPAELSASSFDRELDRRWRRTSFSDITAGAYEAHVGSEPEQPLVDDEPEVEQSLPVTPAEPTELSVPSLLAGIGAGTAVGTFVHSVLERTDFAAADLETELSEVVSDVNARRPVELGDRSQLVTGLAAAIRTPLGPVLSDRALCDFGRADRLDELSFELPLAGGDRPTGELTLARVAEVLRASLAPSDALAGYADRLSDEALRRVVRGYLTGILDLVVRLPAGEPVPGGFRYAVLDYKTNWLAGPDEPLTSFHYRPEALRDQMERHHYALQALLYTVALHRYLRWRLPGYDPDLHVAGVAYLFLRGMTGPGTAIHGRSPGVFGWRPPAGLVQALSDAFAGPERSAAR